MKLSIKQRRANKKAWQYFRELVNDDEKYFSFKNKGTPLEINGSDGGKYYLYPSGKFARISDDEPRLGSVNFGRDMPEADYFSTLFVWITKNEKVFKEKFGCGSISAHHRRQEQVDPNPYIPANFIGEATTFHAWDTTEHPIISLEDDWDTSYNTNYIVTIYQRFVDESGSGFVRNSIVCVVMGQRAYTEYDVNCGDVIEVNDNYYLIEELHTHSANNQFAFNELFLRAIPALDPNECVAEQVGGEIENGEN